MKVNKWSGRQAHEEAAADEEQPSAELKYLPGCFAFCFFSLSHLNMTHGTLHEIHPYDFVFARDKLLSLHHQLVVIIIRPNASSFTLKCTVWSWAIATATTTTWQRRRRRSSTWGLWLARGSWQLCKTKEYSGGIDNSAASCFDHLTPSWWRIGSICLLASRCCSVLKQVHLSVVHHHHQGGG